MIKEVKPTYPEEAKEAGLEGDVVLLIYIDEKGKVRNAVVQASPDVEGKSTADCDNPTSAVEAIENAAVEAAYQCEFEPATVNGEPVGMWYAIVMQFRL